MLMLSMGTTNKVSTSILTIIIVTSSLLLVPLANAQSISKPVSPQFTIQIIDRSYDVPSKTITTTDQYTGQQTTVTQPSYHVENKTIELTIKNQQPSQTTDANGITQILFYNISEKGHFGNDWNYYPQPTYYYASDIAYTTVSFLIGNPSNDMTIYVPEKGELDFAVQAVVGYYHNEVFQAIPDRPLSLGQRTVFIGETSDWSNTQTISIADGSVSVSTSPNPTPTPSVPEFSWLAIIPLMVSILSIAIIVRHRKGKHE
jgi:hypothetical protein